MKRKFEESTPDKATYAVIPWESYADPGMQMSGVRALPVVEVEDGEKATKTD